MYRLHGYQANEWMRENVNDGWISDISETCGS